MSQKNSGRFSWWLAFFLDGLAIFVIGIFAYLLVGDYLKYSYLVTGYQDWIYHAFRIDSLGSYGILSWDHIWGNGVNYWRSYQYLPHVLTLGLKHLISGSTTSAMLLITVLIFTLNLIATYFVLRLLGLRRMAIFLGLALYLTIASPWNAMKDFTIYFSLIFLPAFLYAWILDLKRKQFSYRLPALAGLSWMIHPILGYTCTALYFFLLLPTFRHARRMLTRLGIFFLSWTPFVVPYLFQGYSYSNPWFSSAQFLKQNIQSSQIGIGSMATTFLFVAWIMILLFVSHMRQWVRVIVVFVTLSFGVIMLGKNELLPDLIMRLQLGRMVFILAGMTPFIFAPIFDFFLDYKSRFIRIVMSALLAIFLSRVLEVQSQFAGVASNTLQSPIKSFSSNLSSVQGSIFYPNVSEASFITKHNYRYVTTYNEHLLSSPLSVRFARLMKDDYAYTGITSKQLGLISNYVNVLGVEYLFTPKLSAITANLTATSSATATTEFVEMSEVDDFYAVVKNQRPITFAYAIHDYDTVSFSELPLPTLRSNSWEIWDRDVTRLDVAIKSKVVTPLSLSFAGPDKLVIQTTNLPPNTRGILVTQNYDNNWKVVSPGADSPIPTSLRFMFLELNGNGLGDQIVLENHWPLWYWPVQWLGITFAIILITVESIYQFVKSRRHHAN